MLDRIRTVTRPPRTKGEGDVYILRAVHLCTVKERVRVLVQES